MPAPEKQEKGLRKQRNMLVRLLRLSLLFARLWVRGVIRHNCKVHAAALTFFTLLALAPLLVLLAKLVSVLPNAASDIQQAQELLFEVLVPESADLIRSHLEGFGGRANAITLAGVPMLMISVLALMLQLEKVLCGIFAMKRRKLVLQILFAILSLLFGPVVLSLLFSIAAWMKQLAIIGWLPWGLGTEIISLGVQGLIASIFFVLVPSHRLPLDLAFCGGLLLVLGQNGLRLGFTKILGSIANYEVVYGFFAAIPLFLLWVYFCWMLLLLIAVLLQTLRTFQNRGHLPSLV